MTGVCVCVWCVWGGRPALLCSAALQLCSVYFSALLLCYCCCSPCSPLLLCYCCYCYCSPLLSCSALLCSTLLLLCPHPALTHSFTYAAAQVAHTCSAALRTVLQPPRRRGPGAAACPGAAWVAPVRPPGGAAPVSPLPQAGPAPAGPSAPRRAPSKRSRPRSCSSSSSSSSSSTGWGAGAGPRRSPGPGGRAGGAACPLAGGRRRTSRRGRRRLARLVAPPRLRHRRGLRGRHARGGGEGAAGRLADCCSTTAGGSGGQGVGGRGEGHCSVTKDGVGGRHSCRPTPSHTTTPARPCSPLLIHHLTHSHTFSHLSTPNLFTPAHTISHHLTPSHTFSHHLTPSHTIPYTD